MSGYKPRPSRIRARLGLTTKQVGGGYYKGNRTGSMGFFGPKKGTYFIDYRKVRTYVVPEGLEDFKVSFLFINNSISNSHRAHRN